MPANKKYLSSGWQRFAKVTAALIGALLLVSFFFAALAFWLPDYKIAVVTSVYALFPLWVVLMIIPFLFENGWKCWLYYFIALLVLYLFICFGRH